MKEAEAYILGIPKFAEKIGTENLGILMERLGNPHQSIKTIHIAGTNGKGSVTEMLRSMLTEAGYRTGAFTSPHLVSIRERFAIDGKMISEEDFLSCYRLVRKESEELAKEGVGHPSYFEFLFAMAAVYFREQKVDYAVFETGMGGRLDATNLLLPELSVITSIGYDHMQYLGDTIEKIAWEKAGIIKNGVPVVTHTQNETAGRVIQKEAEARHATWIPVEKSKVIINEKSLHTIDFSVESRYYNYYSLKLCTGALYQVDNAVTAMTAFHILLSDRLSAESMEQAVRKSLSHFFWQGRMEFIRFNVVVDGAHNEDAMERFIESAKEISDSYGGGRTKLLFAVSNDKDYDTMIRMITERLAFHTIYITELHSDRRTDTDKVRRIFQKYLGDSHDTVLVTDDDIHHSLDHAIEELKDTELLFCVGSLYLAGEIREHFYRRKEHD